MDRISSEREHTNDGFFSYLFFGSGSDIVTFFDFVIYEDSISQKLTIRITGIKFLLTNFTGYSGWTEIISLPKISFSKLWVAILSAILSFAFGWCPLGKYPLEYPDTLVFILNISIIPVFFYGYTKFRYMNKFCRYSGNIDKKTLFLNIFSVLCYSKSGIATKIFFSAAFQIRFKKKRFLNYNYVSGIGINLFDYNEQNNGIC